MSTSSINNLSGYLQSVLSAALQPTGSTTSTTGKNLNGVNTPAVQPQPDSTQLSPLAQLLSELQQLQQSDPAKYQQVTQQIATNLQSAAQTAQEGGNTTAANQLTQLASDFTTASQSGQLPDIQDLAQAVGGGHHHGHHHHSESATANSNSSSGAGNTSTTDSSGSSSGSSTLDTSLLVNQYLAGVQASGTQSDSQNPLGIILNTLSSAGISLSNS
jgi:hypothetical protein